MTSSSTDPRIIRRFGFIALIFFGVFCAIAFWRHRQIMTVFFGTLAVLGVSFILLPGPMQPVYRVWLKVGHAIGKFINLLCMALAYFIVITPAATVMRILGKRPLSLKPDKNRPSYWVPRTEPAQPVERFSKRY